MTEILACPFCGSNRTSVEVKAIPISGWRVYCRACNSSGPFKDTPEAAIAAWNSVAGMAEVLGRIAKQKTTDEMEVEGDIEFGYDSIIYDARKALQALNQAGGRE